MPKDVTITVMASPKKRTPAKARISTASKTKTARNKSKTAGTLSGRNKRVLISPSIIKKTTIFLTVLAVALAGIFWYYKIYASPERIFWGMIDNSLSIRSVTKEIDTKNNTLSTLETVQMNFVPSPMIRDLKKITDAGSQPPTTIILEARGTSDTDYQRYVLIDRPAAPGQAKTDYQSVYDKWVKSGSDQPFGGPQLVNNSLFGPLLFGYIEQPLRRDIVNQLRQAYKIDYGSVVQGNQNGRRVYTFQVEVQLQQYARAAQQYARKLGLPIADQIQPDGYDTSAKTTVNITVDALSRQVRQVIYTSNNSYEIYSSYGISPDVSLPQTTVSSEQFQKAINDISQ